MVEGKELIKVYCMTEPGEPQPYIIRLMTKEELEKEKEKMVTI